MKVERKADHAVSEASCKAATGKTLAEWFKALDKHGGITPARGHEGDSAGADTLRSLVRAEIAQSGQSHPATTPVYGCPLASASTKP